MTNYRDRLDAGEFDQKKPAPAPKTKAAAKAHPHDTEATPTPVGPAATSRTPAAKRPNTS